MLSQELKQDISSFRYEVMGMMKTGKPALQGAKASSSSVESNLAYPNSSLKVSSCPQSSQVKSKLNRFKITASILKQCSSIASPRPPEAFNGLPNGLLSLASDENPSENSSQRKTFPKDVTEFGLFHKCHWGGNEATSGAGEISREMYSLSEEAGESGGSDNEDQVKEQTSRNKDERVEVSAVAEAANEDSKLSNTKCSLEEDVEKETSEKDKESLSHVDPVADGCLTGTCRDEA